MPPRPRSADFADRYWRTFLRKLGEDLDLAGKGVVSRCGGGHARAIGIQGRDRLSEAVVMIGIHLQAQAKPDE